MKTRLIGMMVLVLLLAHVPGVLALRGPSIVVTAATQVEQGLEVTLTATPADGETLFVRMEIPKKGKLQNLSLVQMELKDANGPFLQSLLATTQDGDRLIISFLIARYLVNSCHVNLYIEVDPHYTICYAVNVKSYIPDKD